MPRADSRTPSPHAGTGRAPACRARPSYAEKMRSSGIASRRPVDPQRLRHLLVRPPEAMHASHPAARAPSIAARAPGTGCSSRSNASARSASEAVDQAVRHRPAQMRRRPCARCRPSRCRGTLVHLRLAERSALARERARQLAHRDALAVDEHAVAVEDDEAAGDAAPVCARSPRGAREQRLLARQRLARRARDLDLHDTRPAARGR